MTFLQAGAGAGRHPSVLFSLRARNNRAKEVISDRHNKPFVSKLRLNGRTIDVLDIGHIRSGGGDSATLATLGRNGDIRVEAAEISRQQCSFEIDQTTNVVMLHDRSTGQSTQFFGKNAVPFEAGRIRRVVVAKNVNTNFGMGGVGGDLVQFEICWHSDPDALPEKLAERERCGLQDNPRLARTVVEMRMADPTGVETRIHTPGPSQPMVRWDNRGFLGGGEFGNVYDGLNLDSGKRMAVKVINGTKTARSFLKREVEILSHIKHKHIVEYIGFQEWGTRNSEIFMGLNDGTFRALFLGPGRFPIFSNCSKMAHDMLMALDYLAVKGIIHGDVKPENILYTLRDDRYEFQLADFGLSSRQHQVMATARTGSPFYMAPEVHASQGVQTPKADIWSLFVTLMWAMDMHDARKLEADQVDTGATYQKIMDTMLSAASRVVSSPFREMADPDPTSRASAAQMLIKLYGGEGLTTPENNVPGLTWASKEGVWEWA